MHLGFGFGFGYHPFRPYEAFAAQLVSIQLLSGGNTFERPTQLSIVDTRSGESKMHPSSQINSENHEVLDSASLISSDHRLQSRNVFSNPRPPYPLISRRMGQKGGVHLKLCVNPDGIVRDIWIEKSSGYAALDKSALETVRAWRFLALHSGNSSVECYRLPVNFTLKA